jgi:hypothetical protein
MTMAEEVRGFLTKLLGIYIAFNLLFATLQMIPLMTQIDPSVDPIAWTTAWSSLLVKTVLPDLEIMIVSFLIAFLTAIKV